jgi:hypothetical protein
MRRGLRVTPFQKAQDFLQQLNDRAMLDGTTLLPGIQYAQIGMPDMACESLIVAVTTVAPDAGEEGGPVICDASQMATFLVVWCQACSWVSDDSGINDPAKVAEVSARMDAAGTFLWDWANEMDAYLSKQWTLGWASAADLGITTLTLTTGVD